MKNNVLVSFKSSHLNIVKEKLWYIYKFILEIFIYKKQIYKSAWNTIEGNVKFTQDCQGLPPLELATYEVSYNECLKKEKFIN